MREPKALSTGTRVSFVLYRLEIQRRVGLPLYFEGLAYRRLGLRRGQRGEEWRPALVLVAADAAAGRGLTKHKG